MTSKAKAVPTNAANLEWPTDQYRFTTLLKKELVKSVSSVNGQKDKLDVLVKTLELGIKFAKAKGKSDMAARAAYLAALAPEATEESEDV